MGKPSSGSLSDEEKNLRLMGHMPKYASWQFDSISRHVRGDTLEIGGGTGTVSRMLLSHIEPPASLTITETNRKNMADLRKALGADCAAGRKFAISNDDLESGVPAGFSGKFDTVLSVNVMEHVADDRSFFRNCCACLKKGGRLAIIVPAMRFLFGTTDEADSHKRRYEKADLRALAGESGLRVLSLRYMNLPGALGWYYHGKIRKIRVHEASDLSFFERLVPLFRAAESIIPPPFGLSLVFVGEKL